MTTMVTFPMRMLQEHVYTLRREKMLTGCLPLRHYANEHDEWFGMHSPPMRLQLAVDTHSPQSSTLTLPVCADRWGPYSFKLMHHLGFQPAVDPFLHESFSAPLEPPLLCHH